METRFVRHLRIEGPMTSLGVENVGQDDRRAREKVNRHAGPARGGRIRCARDVRAGRYQYAWKAAGRSALPDVPCPGAGVFRDVLDADAYLVAVVGTTVCTFLPGFAGYRGPLSAAAISPVYAWCLGRLLRGGVPAWQLPADAVASSRRASRRSTRRRSALPRTHRSGRAGIPACHRT